MKGNVVALPDITFIGTSPVVQVQSTTVDVGIGIINASTIAAAATSGELHLDGTLNKAFRIPALSATSLNNQVVVNLSFPKPASGLHSIQVKLDSGNIIFESHENDNVKSRSFTIP